MRQQKRKVELGLVSAEELRAEMKRREQEEFVAMFNDLGPMSVELYLYPDRGPRLATPIVISPDGTWKYA